MGIQRGAHWGNINKHISTFISTHNNCPGNGRELAPPFSIVALFRRTAWMEFGMALLPPLPSFVAGLNGTFMGPSWVFSPMPMWRLIHKAFAGDSIPPPLPCLCIGIL
ncbi:hypothetical protein FKM82_005842 [Ascaphus truei]